MSGYSIVLLVVLSLGNYSSLQALHSSCRLFSRRLSSCALNGEGGRGFGFPGLSPGNEDDNDEGLKHEHHTIDEMAVRGPPSALSKKEDEFQSLLDDMLSEARSNLGGRDASDLSSDELAIAAEELRKLKRASDFQPRQSEVEPVAEAQSGVQPADMPLSDKPPAIRNLVFALVLSAILTPVVSAIIKTIQ